MIHNSVDELQASIRDIVRVQDGTLAVVDPHELRTKAIDALVFDAVFGTPEVQATTRWIIWELGQALGIKPASIHDFYMARGHGAYGDLTVPAMNIRGMTWDSTRAVFRAAVRHRVGAMIFEIARSEIGYTDQRPAEYAVVVIAAAIKEGFVGPVFIQGDHFQVNAKKWAKDPDSEVNAIKALAQEAIEAGFHNIDIDTSTLVDLSQPTVETQQRNNYELCAELSTYIRSIEPRGVTVSLGGEIGEVGGKNSTADELRAFTDGYLAALGASDPHMAGISKISVQTGTSHGGVVLPDGTLAQVSIDFDVLYRLSKIAREEYGMAGAVQHGASTLPESAFSKFVEAGACEVHLATGFQNIIYEHPALPRDLKNDVYAWLAKNCADERKPSDTDEQFYYKTRKKGFAPFKAQWWNLPHEVKAVIGESLENQFAFLFKQLNVVDTLDLVKRHVGIPTMHKPMPEAGATFAVSGEDVSGLAD
jgi:fructose/tagatose bisphosphate aldolase